MARDFHAEHAQELDEVFDVADFGHIVDCYLARCQQCGADYLQSFVFCTLRYDFAAERPAAFDYE